MKRQPIQMLFFILYFFSTFLGAEKGSVYNEVYNICLIIENNSPVLANISDQSTVMERYNLGDVCLTVEPGTIAGEKDYYELLLPSGKRGWIKNSNCRMMPLETVNGTGKKDHYPVFNSPLMEKVIITKQKAGRFNIKKIAVAKSGSEFETMFRVTFYSYDLKRHCIDYHESGWVKGSLLSKI